MDLSDVLTDADARIKLEQMTREITFDFALPNLSTFNNALSVMYNAVGGDDAYFGEPLQLDISIENCTPMVQPFRLKVKDSESFYLNGITETEMSILPFETSTFRYAAIPIQTGNVALPKFEVSTLRDMTSVVFDQEVWTVHVHPAKVPVDDLCDEQQENGMRDKTRFEGGDAIKA